MRTSGKFYLAVKASPLRSLPSVPCNNACKLLHHHSHTTCHFLLFLKSAALPNTISKCQSSRGVKNHHLLHIAVHSSVASDNVILVLDVPAGYDWASLVPKLLVTRSTQGDGGDLVLKFGALSVSFWVLLTKQLHHPTGMVDCPEIL